jgi:hypothetical protein
MFTISCSTASTRKAWSLSCNCIHVSRRRDNRLVWLLFFLSLKKEISLLPEDEPLRTEE